MNREILFRGKRADTGEWIEGFYCGGNERKTLRPCIFVYRPDRQIYDCQDIIPETVGQFTGLTDKDGKRIFEGDIIAGKIGKFVIRWSEAICSFVAEEGFKMVPCVNQGTMQNYEVVGNTYDNPELLEVTED